MISIVLCTMRPEFKENLLNNFFRQDFSDKEMIIVLNNNQMSVDEWEKETEEYENIRIYRFPEEKTLGECLNFGISKCKYEIIAKFDDDDYYSEKYLTEAYKAMVKTKADIVGKCTAFIYFEEYQKLMIFRDKNENKTKKSLKGGTLVFKKSVWERIKFRNKAVSSDSHFLRDARKRKFKLYSTSKYNYLCIRRKDARSHTQKLEASTYMKRCKPVMITSNPQNIVISK